MIDACIDGLLNILVVVIAKWVDFVSYLRFIRIEMELRADRLYLTVPLLHSMFRNILIIILIHWLNMFSHKLRMPTIFYLNWGR